MPQEKSLELKVGLFVSIAIILLVCFIFSISDSPIFEQGSSLKVVFGFANGLKKSAPVRVAGVDQGIVKDLHLFFDGKDQKMKAQINLWIKKELQIPQDSVIMINQLGLMGEKYIEIIPGKNTAEFIGEDQVLIGIDPVAQEAIAQKIMEVATGLDKMINDTTNKASIGDTLKNFSLLTGNLTQITSDIRDGQGTLGMLLYDGRMYEDLQGLTADLRVNPWKLLYRPRK